MAAVPDTFLVTCSGIHAFGIDQSDTGVEPDEHTVFAFVYFKPRLSPDHVIWATGLSPARGVHIDDVKARFSPTDGVLRTIAESDGPDGGTDPDDGVKLIANTALLGLEELIYDVTFEVPESDRVIRGFGFVAPTTTSQTVPLESVTKLPLDH
jgi:hypothetical protein